MVCYWYSFFKFFCLVVFRFLRVFNIILILGNLFVLLRVLGNNDEKKCIVV